MISGFSVSLLDFIGRPQTTYWSGRRDSNPRPSGPKPDALPDCATPRLSLVYRIESGTVSNRAEHVVRVHPEQDVHQASEHPCEQKHRQQNQGDQDKAETTEKEPALHGVLS